jgi:midasin (ATPase involved in ribosome maturation)
LAESGKIAYHASPLVTAMVRGGVCLLDEGNRMNEKSWASLAPLLDHSECILEVQHTRKYQGRVFTEA